VELPTGESLDGVKDKLWTDAKSELQKRLSWSGMDWFTSEKATELAIEVFSRWRQLHPQPQGEVERLQAARDVHQQIMADQNRSIERLRQQLADRQLACDEWRAAEIERDKSPHASGAWTIAETVRNLSNKVTETERERDEERRRADQYSEDLERLGTQYDAQLTATREQLAAASERVAELESKAITGRYDLWDETPTHYVCGFCFREGKTTAEIVHCETCPLSPQEAKVKP
jgi:exonuclease VII large subunit